MLSYPKQADRVWEVADGDRGVICEEGKGKVAMA